MPVTIFNLTIYNEFTLTQFTNKYNLEERTAKLGERLIEFCKSVKQDNINGSLINQLVRAATSVGANYMEANGASSKQDFRNKVFICKKELQETKHWLRMMATCVSERKKELRDLWEETQELTMIFQKITSSLRARVN